MNEKIIDNTLNFLKLDFHIHSCHSACGSLDMSPKNVISILKEKGINIAAISDHNSIKNSFSFISYGMINNICVFPACEIQTEEEIHIVIVFPNLEIAQRWQDWIDKIIPKITLNPELFGDEPIVDEDENILELPEILYSVSLPVSFEEIEKKAFLDNLIFYPAHITDPSYSIISQIGFIPENHLFTCAEVSNSKDYENFKKSETDFMLITNSDAHYLNQIGLRYNCLFSKDLEKAYKEFVDILQKENKNKIGKDIEKIKNEIFLLIKDIFSNKNKIQNMEEILKPIFNR
jgi:PHP family Zn ribbon phosphoesterase